jgi:hypothetical protein
MTSTLTATHEIIETIREVIATAQVHGGTRVIEMTATRFAGVNEWHVECTTYDSNHRHDARWFLAGWYDQLDRPRTEYVDTLDIRPDEDGFCGCWQGWDPQCGDPSCWGVPARN